IPHLGDLRRRGYACAMHMTINGYPRAIESHNPSLVAALAAFRSASAALGAEWTFWRYDPIMLSDHTPAEYHLERFDAIARALEGATHRCYFSFTNFYGKTERNVARLEHVHGVRVERDVPAAKQRALAHALRDIAARRGVTLYACCAPDLVGEGIAPSRCIDLDVIRRLRDDDDLNL